MICVFTHSKSMQNYDLFCQFSCAGVSSLIRGNSILDDSLSLLQIYSVSWESCLAFICFSTYKRGLKILPIFKKYFQNYRWERLLSVGNKPCCFRRELWNGACFGCESHLPPLENKMLYLTLLLISPFFLKKNRDVWAHNQTKGFLVQNNLVLHSLLSIYLPFLLVTLVSFSTWWNRREWRLCLAAVQESCAFSF